MFCSLHSSPPLVTLSNHNRMLHQEWPLEEKQRKLSGKSFLPFSVRCCNTFGSCIGTTLHKIDLHFRLKRLIQSFTSRGKL